VTSSTHGNTQNQLYEAIGRLVVRFAWLEDNLHDAISVALHPAEGKLTNVLTAGLQFRTLVEKIGALLHDHSGRRAALEDIDTLCKELNALNDERNIVIHSVYGQTRQGQQKAYKRTARAKAGFSLNVRDVTIADIEALTSRIDNAERTIWALVP